jgi:general secretion pathway protein G
LILDKLVFRDPPAVGSLSFCSYGNSQKALRGFTLIEMLVVLVLVGLLASLVGPRLFSKVDTAKVQTAQTQIKLLKGALETLRLDLGEYPNVPEGLTWLVSAPSDTAISARWKGPYLDGALPMDPWGRAYQYIPPVNSGQAFGIVSYGSDGKLGGTESNADIGDVAKEPGKP